NYPPPTARRTLFEASTGCGRLLRARPSHRVDAATGQAGGTATRKACRRQSMPLRPVALIVRFRRRSPQWPLPAATRLLITRPMGRGHAHASRCGKAKPAGLGRPEIIAGTTAHVPGPQVTTTAHANQN